jgi:hypothetical protein
MLPKTDASAVPCSNISSNCVIWQGPDIPCIDLCTGDTVSDVVAALAQQLCDLVIPEPDADGLDLLCVLPQGQAQPTELKDVVQLIIDYVCDEEDDGEFVLPTIPLPSCLYYPDPDTGQEVTALVLDQYAILLGTEICKILDEINLINIQLADHEIRITILEDCVLDEDGNCNIGGGDPDVFSSCILPDQTVAASVLLLALETAFCNLQDAVGAPPLITAAINQAGCITASHPMLGSPGTYGGVNGWVNTPTTLAHAVGNAWIVICDMHQAIQTIQENCCPGPCDETVFAYDATIATNSAGNPTGVEFTFTNSNIPSGFTDCGGNTTITITDLNGVSANQNFVFSNYANTTTPFTFNLSNSSLNLFADLNISIPFCITNGTDQCEQTLTSVVESAAACPSPVTIEGVTQDEAFITFQNTLGTSAIFTVTLTDLDDGTGNNIITVSNLPLSASIHLTNLEGDTNYQIVLQLTLNGITQTCTTDTFQTDFGGVLPGQGIQTSGAAGEYLIPVQVGTAAGTFDVHFNAQGQPDRIQLYYSPTSNNIANMTPVADSLYVGDNTSPNLPQNGVYPLPGAAALQQFTYVGTGNGTVGTGNAWNVTNNSIVLQIADNIVCNNTSTKTNATPTNGQSRNGSAGTQVGVLPLWYLNQNNYDNNNPSTGGLHANGNVSLRFVKPVTTSSIMYIRVTNAQGGTAWDIWGTSFTP